LAGSIVERRKARFTALKDERGRIASQLGLLARNIGQDLESAEIVHVGSPPRVLISCFFWRV
jgi:hypothetical protein